MKTQCRNPDIISTLPENITEKILSLIPIQEALRTSVLSKKWRYSWRNMPKLVFKDDMVEVHSNCDCGELKRYKALNAILHVLSLHNCPTILEFDFFVLHLDMHPDFARILSCIERGNKVKELKLFIDHSLSLRKLPVSFFSFHGLEVIHLSNCTFEPPPTFKGFGRLKSLTFSVVYVSSKTLQWFLSKCPLLEHIRLAGNDEDYEYVAGRNKFTFVDLFRCAPLIRSLDISICYMKYFSESGMPHKLPTSLVHLKHLYMQLWLMEQNEISSALCIIRSSPFLEKLQIMVYERGELLVQETPNNFLDLEHYTDLKLDHLEIFEVVGSINLPFEMEFVKLIMAKSPVLKEVRIELDNITVEGELEMFRDLVRLPFPRASPFAKLLINRM